MRPKFSLKRREHKFILLIKDPIFFTLPFELAALLSTVTGFFNLFLFSFFLFSSLSSHNIFAGDFFCFFSYFSFLLLLIFQKLIFFPFNLPFSAKNYNYNSLNLHLKLMASIFKFERLGRQRWRNEVRASCRPR